jgi:hypothetical protein
MQESVRMTMKHIATSYDAFPRMAKNKILVPHLVGGTRS